MGSSLTLFLTGGGTSFLYISTPHKKKRAFALLLTQLLLFCPAWPASVSASLTHARAPCGSGHNTITTILTSSVTNGSGGGSALLQELEQKLELQLERHGQPQGKLLLLPEAKLPPTERANPKNPVGRILYVEWFLPFLRPLRPQRAAT